MAEHIAAEFDLDPATLADLMKRKNETLRQAASMTAWVAMGIVGLLIGQVGPAIALFALEAFSGLLAAKTPRFRQSVATRSAGPTKVVFSDEGMDFRGANVAERVQCARIRRVYDRPGVWSFMTKAPTTTFLVPKSAVPAQTREQFAAQLRDWAGPAYKARKGWPGPAGGYDGVPFGH